MLVHLWIHVFRNVYKWKEERFRALTPFKLPSHPEAKRLIEEWSGSLFNKDTFISTAVSTHFQLPHTHTHVET